MTPQECTVEHYGSPCCCGAVPVEPERLAVILPFVRAQLPADRHPVSDRRRGRAYAAAWARIGGAA